MGIFPAIRYYYIIVLYPLGDLKWINHSLSQNIHCFNYCGNFQKVTYVMNSKHVTVFYVHLLYPAVTTTSIYIVSKLLGTSINFEDFNV